MTKDIYDDRSDKNIEYLIDEYVRKLYSNKIDEEAVQIRHNIWAIKEAKYKFNIIVTSLLIIFDAELFDHLPENKLMYFEDLLLLNAHHAKTSKLCLINEKTHLRVIRGLEDFDYSEFVAHVEEYREIFPELKEKLIEKYFPYE